MIPLSITSSDLARLAKLSVALGTIAAAFVVAVRWNTFQLSPVSVLGQALSAAFSAPALGILVVRKINWRYPWISKLMGRRMVHGLWWGELNSDYIETPGASTLPPIPIAFVIRQTYLTLSIKSYTSAIPGESILETLHAHPVTGDANLRYAYQMTRRANAENKATLGYGDLVLGSEDKELCGDYWTNSPSSGRIRLTLLTRDCDDVRSFTDAQRINDRLKAVSV
ncbi:hypothetical protein SAMN05660284_02478 [Formivibrio citricus]|uniref:Uncharacterized protein n=1 Tax=Formivibrio citricus TaxID=83765 RepID=A0A1I5CT66_9NEIS|nr:hypothetical protein [Formivibrio citricus]SFN90170.1 hypothetical protein SAMN05660284_02478 [Formivibrio citricus]